MKKLLFVLAIVVAIMFLARVAQHAEAKRINTQNELIIANFKAGKQIPADTHQQRRQALAALHQERMNRMAEFRARAAATRSIEPRQARLVARRAVSEEIQLWIATEGRKIQDTMEALIGPNPATREMLERIDRIRQQSVPPEM